MKFILRVTAFCCTLALPAAATEIVVEAESLADPGGWSLDTQHMETMGSSYLLAHGLGNPVADAKGVFAAPSAGSYTLWVRTRNWTAPWSDAAAGVFRVEVNGKCVGGEFGLGGGEWRWAKAEGKVELVKGVNTLALKDLTGFDARCDAVAFTSGDDEPVRAEKVISSSKSFDLVVCGGGVAGMCAALAAARSGLKVALLQDRDVLGGNNSSEVRVWLGGHQQCGRYPRLGDVVAEIGPAGGGNSRAARFFEDGKKLDVVKREKNISLFLGTKALAVETARDGAVAAVVGVDVRTGGRTRFTAPLFVDATGDGTVGYLAKADYRMGRESKSETGEEHAPDKPDMLTMGTSCQWRAIECNRPEPFAHRPWMLEFNEQNATFAMRGDWNWETGFGRDQVVEAERIRDYGMMVAYSNWSFVKNFSSRRDQFATKRLNWVAYVAGKRESRRLLGDVVLTETDVHEYVRHPDGTCLASWSIDLHYPKTSETTGFKGESFRSYCIQREIVLYPIPYRSFYSRNVPNLFMAGRNISVTHNALGTVRVMRTTGMIGEVVGMAAAVCKERSCRPRDVYGKYFADLQRRMERGAGAGLAKTRQDYNIHPTLGLDPDDPAEIKRNASLKWGMVDLLREKPPAVVWSYPAREWQRLSGGVKPPAGEVEFKSADGTVVKVPRDADGVAALRGRGFSTRDTDGTWAPCDEFSGFASVPAHRMETPREQSTSSFSFGYFSAGETYAYVYCLAKEKPDLVVGESLAEVKSDEASAFGRPFEMVGAGESGVWRSKDPLGFRYYRLTGEIEDTWVISVNARRIPFGNGFEIKPAGAGGLSRREKKLQSIWNSAAETVRLLSWRSFISSLKRPGLPVGRDMAIALLADSASYKNAEVARFTIDAASSRLDGDNGAWWVMANSLYRRLYGDVGYVRSRWKHVREAAGKLSPAEPESAASKMLRAAAISAAAEMARELCEKADAERFSAAALAFRDAAQAAYVPGGDPLGDIYAIVFGLADRTQAGLAAKSLCGREWTADGDIAVETFGCLALALAGRGDDALKRVERIWGGMIDLGGCGTFKRFRGKTGDIYAEDGHPFALPLCHIAGAGSAYLVPKLVGKDASNPFGISVPGIR